MTSASNPVPEVLPARRYLPWYRRWLPSWRVVAVALLLLLTTPFAIRTYRLSRMPDVPVPFDMEAFAAMPEDEKNANFYFTQAEDPGGYDYFDLEESYSKGKLLTWAGVPEGSRIWLDKKRPALEFYRRGAKCPTCVMLPPKDYRSFSNPFSWRLHKPMMLLSAIESLRLLDLGESTAAAEVLHDAFRATRHLGNRGYDLDRRSGALLHYYVMPAWRSWSRHRDVTADDLNIAIFRLQDDWKLTSPISESLKLEYFMLSNEALSQKPQAAFRFFLDQWVDEHFPKNMPIGPTITAASLNTHLPGWQTPILWTMGEPELTLHAGRLYLTHELPMCDLPTSRRPARFPDGARLSDTEGTVAGLSSAELNQRIAGSMWSEMAEGGANLEWWLSDEAARQALLETELGIQRLYRVHDCRSRAEAEQSLASFAWPTDPTDPVSGVVRHRSSDDGLVIWCLGPNGIDDQGTFPKMNQPGDVVVIVPWPTNHADPE